MPRVDLMKLNEEDIRQMWYKLDTAERLHLATTCDRFRKMFETYDVPQYVDFKLENLWPMTFKDVEYFSKLISPQLEVLRSDTPCINNLRSRKFLKILADNCSRIRSIIFKGIKVSFACYELFAKAHNLSELHLPNCKLTDKDIDMITMLPNLRVLNISNNNNITGNGLYMLRSLKALHLAFCSNLDPKYLIKALKTMKFLAILDIQQQYDNRRLTAVYPELSMHCRNLDKLYVTLPERTNYECLTRLQRLSKIYAFGFVRRFIVDLRAQRARQMEVIYLDAIEEVPIDTTFLLTQFTDLRKLACKGDFEFCLTCIEGFDNLRKLSSLSFYQPDALTQKALFVVMRRCAKLRFMQVSFKDNATEPFIYELIDALEQRSVKMFFVLDLHLSRIRRSIVKDPRCVAAKSMLEISFSGQQLEWDGR